MAHPVNDHALDVIFRDGRSYNGFEDKDVPEILVRAVYDLAKMGPTSANCSPARFVFVSSEEGKSRLLPLVSEGNQQKVKQAKWSVIIAYDMEFHEKIPKLFPHNPSAKTLVRQQQGRNGLSERNAPERLLPDGCALTWARYGTNVRVRHGWCEQGIFRISGWRGKELARQLDLQSWLW